jgi:4-amino-4-deoxy-L-arabinose transferase-like glycosyltransferase
LGLALAGTVAWLWLLRWRTGRHREALWKSLVLPAGGVALCWLLLMTLWLPMLDYARSARPLVARLAALVPAQVCIAAPGVAPATVAALEYVGRWRVDARDASPEGPCNVLLRVTRAEPLPAAPPGWETVGHARRPTDQGEATQIFRRSTPR